ncbi:MAG TPA: diguanylate cyclase [Myxococcaceae bacterium]|nr:diguanylate cyclase [Myxococcaceae bacterium]
MKLTHTLTDAQSLALTQLFPQVLVQGENALNRAVEILIEQEQQRRGAVDGKTGAIPVAALLQGSFLKQEYDAGLHFGEEGWRLHGLMVDVKEMTLQNRRLGFERGDALLAAVVATLRSALPGTEVVRLHSDAFAALYLPTLGGTPGDDAARRLGSALQEAMVPFTSAEAGVGFTIAELSLTIVQPAHWQVIGPLVWSEFERALLLERLGRASGVQRRRVELDAAIPGPATTAREW